MPMFEFKCESCGFVSEEMHRNETPDVVECDVCGADAERALSDFGFVFDDYEVAGHTGVDSVDSDVDKIVGRDAERRWERVKDRKAKKRKIQRKHGGDDVPLRMNEHGEYEPMPKKDVDRFNEFHRTYSEASGAVEDDS